jgi:hypothetical protein
MLDEELPNGVGGVQRRRRCGNAEPFQEQAGLTTVADPVDARARIIELTPRGRHALRVMRSNALNLEQRWQQVLGERRLGELRKMLTTLLSAETPELEDQ